VSGDSRGHTELWSGKYGTLEASFAEHEADVLAIAVNEGEDTIYASGVDNKIISIRKVSPTGKERWVLSKKARDHTHDVRALALGPQGLLVTGGVDTNLIVYSVLDFGRHGAQVRKIPPFPQQPFISMAAEAGKEADTAWLLYQHPRKLQLWSLGSHDDDTASLPGQSADDAVWQTPANTDRTLLPKQSTSSKVLTLAVKQGPSMLIEILPTTVNNLVSSAISSDGQYLAYSCCSTVRVLSVSRAGAVVNLARVKKLPSAFEPAQAMFFTRDNSKLVTVTMNHGLQILDLATLQVASLEGPGVFDAGQGTIPGPCLLALSDDSSRVAVANNAAIHIVNTSTCTLVLKLPMLASQPTAFAFAPNTHVLVVACVDKTIFMYNADPKVAAFTQWSRNHSEHLPYQWLRRSDDKVLGITFDPAVPDSVLLYTHGLLCVIRMDRKMPGRKHDFNRDRHVTGQSAPVTGPRGAKRKTDTDAGKGEDGEAAGPPGADDAGKEPQPHQGGAKQPAKQPGGFKLIKRYQPLLFAGYTGADTMVVVERPWMAIMQTFPAPLYRSKYGS